MSRASEEDATISREGAGDMCPGTVDSYYFDDGDDDHDNNDSYDNDDAEDVSGD